MCCDCVFVVWLCVVVCQYSVVAMCYVWLWCGVDACCVLLWLVRLICLLVVFVVVVVAC